MGSYFDGPWGVELQFKEGAFKKEPRLIEKVLGDPEFLLDSVRVSVLSDKLNIQEEAKRGVADRFDQVLNGLESNQNIKKIRLSHSDLQTE